MSDPAAGFLAFSDASPTPFHVVAESSARLVAAGFVELLEDEMWSAKAEGGAQVVRGGQVLLHAQQEHDCGLRRRRRTSRAARSRSSGRTRTSRC